MIEPSEGVQRALDEHAERLPGIPLLIACSGGPDSLALVHLAVAARRDSAVTPIHVAVVDHQLQEGSSAIAASAAQLAQQLGADECHILTVDVEPAGEGLEAAARFARRSALLQCAENIGAEEIWLGHTLDDQAETVLLGLARGSGARSLAGMPERDDPWVRPLLKSRRSEVHAALPNSVTAWSDPHNTDTRFLRAQVRAELMPLVQELLGQKAVVNLARTADLLRSDDAALEAAATSASEAALVERGDASAVFAREALAAEPEAVRHRVMRRELLAAGCRPADVTSAHYARIDVAICATAKVGPLAMPSGVSITAEGNRLAIRSATLGS